MRIHKLLLVFLTSLALAGCGTKSWDWFFGDEEEEEIAYEEEVMVDEDFEEEDEEGEYEYEEEYEEEYEDEYEDEYDRRDSRRGEDRRRSRSMSRYGDEPEYEEDRDSGRRQAAGRTPRRTAIYFDYKKDVVPANGLNLLQLHAQFLKANPDAVVTVEGHTDSVAPADYNKRLGLRRAQAIADVLVDMGVSPSQIVTVSYGEERPVQPGDSDSAHAMNRRVELAY